MQDWSYGVAGSPSSDVASGQVLPVPRCLSTFSPMEEGASSRHQDRQDAASLAQKRKFAKMGSKQNKNMAYTLFEDTFELFN